MPAHPRQFLGTNPHLWLCSLLILTLAIPSNSLEPPPQRGLRKNPTPTFVQSQLCIPKQEHRINFKTLSEGLFFIVIYMPALPPVGWDPSESNSVRMHSAGKEQAVLKILQKPFLWHSLMKLLWKTINVSEKKPKLKCLL